MVTGARGLPGIPGLDRRPSTDRLSEGGDELRPPVGVADEDPAVITFTTGTTGPPRAIVRTHGVLRGQHEALGRLRPAGPGDIDLAGLPMLVLHDLARGVAAVLPPQRSVIGRPAGRALAAAVRRLRVSNAGGFPPLFEDLATFAPPDGYPDLRAIHIGGAPVAPELVRSLMSIAPNAVVTVVYGATEAEPIAAIDGADYIAAAAARSPGHGICVGRPVAGLETRLAAAAEGLAEGMPGLGRLEVRGAQVASGGAGSDGWRDLGDLARRDSKGRVWLLGRAANVVDGVAPLVIEQAAEAIAGVRAAAVLPAHPGRGRAVPVVAIEVGAIDRDSAVARVEEMAERRWPGLAVIGLRTLPRERRSGKVDARRLERLVSRATAGSRRITRG